MRNLKKILAMVLALVMSLSLMATAGASSFPDVDDDNPYATAIEVLDELKVFQGYKEDGTFRPTETLNRAQAAVLVYRIATGDVEDKYLDNYTYMQQSKFTDLDGYNWAKGYINYCQNAGIVVGTTATTFDPGAKVTGYQLLVMLLRTLGYGKAGEFADPKGWELQTAAIAEREGITKNVTTGDFGAPAPRQMVAEILFRGLLTETVEYSPLTPNGYTKSVTLGKRELGLEEITGVVVANEFADLYGTDVLAEGKTQVKVEGEDKTRTLNYGTLITDIGESRLIYTQNTARVLYMADTGDNVVKEYGEGVDISSPNKFQAKAEMAQVAGTEFFVNFSTTGYYTSDYRLEYVINFTTAYNGKGTQAAYNTAAEYNFATTTGQVVAWSADGLTLRRVIPAGQRITLTDYDNMWAIFVRSNGQTGTGENTTNAGVYDGKVFVGTQTATDISDTKSFVSFEADYLKPIAYDANWNQSANGQWVKFIDNNNDGDCEYAFLTRYTLDEVISTYTKSADDVVMQYNQFKDDSSARYMNGAEPIDRDVAVGDIVLVAKIDNQWLVSKADSVTTSATSYNYKTDSITAADGETYTQSGIGDVTGMQNQLALMAPKTEYEMFLDKFGFVRAYRQPGGTKYALVTELYYSNNNNGSLVQNWPMTVELAMPDEDGKVAYKEYNLANASGNAFQALTPWTRISNAAMNAELNNWLQPAIAHLGIPSTAVAGTGLPYEVRIAPTLGTKATYWPSNLQITLAVTNLGAKVETNGNVVTSGEFNYGDQLYRNPTSTSTWNAVQDNTVSFTNVAVVGIDGDNATLNSAAKLNRSSTTGQATGYAVDYIQLSTGRPSKGAASYTVADYPAGNAAYYNRVVNADKDTEIYIAYNGGVQYFKGYTNMPALTESLVGRIHAAYAVARNTNTGTGNTAGRNYWMADVIVYEVEKWNDLSKSSISLAYYTALQQMQSVNGVTINTLNSKTDPAKVDLIPSGLNWSTGNNWWDAWGYNTNTGYGWDGYGFYELYNTTDAVDGTMTAQAIRPIREKFNSNGIYAGTVTREIDTAPAGYIPVNMTGTLQDGILKTEALVSIADGKVYSITDDTRTNPTSYRIYTEANSLQFNNVHWSEVKADDQIIWVGGGTMGDAPNSSSFIVDLGNTNRVENGYDQKLCNYDLWKDVPSWLGGGHLNASPAIVSATTLWNAITTEQKTTAPTDTITIKFVYEPEFSTDKAAFAVAGRPSTTSISVGKNTVVQLLTSQASYFEIKGWQVTDMSAVYTGTTTAAGLMNGSAGVGSVTGWNFATGDTNKDITVTVKYRPVTANLTITATKGGTAAFAASDIKVSVNGGTATTYAGGAMNLTYGDTVTLLWTAAEHTTYTTSVIANINDLTTGTTLVGATLTTPSVSFKVVGAGTITITSNDESQITPVGATSASITAWAGLSALYTGEKITEAQPTVAVGYKVTEVYWTDDNGVTKHSMPETAAGSGKYTSIDGIGTKPVTVYAVTEKLTAQILVGSSTLSAVTVKVDYTDAAGAAANAPTVSLNGTVDVKKGTSVKLTFTAPAQAWVVAVKNGNTVNAGLTINGNSTNIVDVLNITEDVTLAVFGSVEDYNSFVSTLK